MQRLGGGVLVDAAERADADLLALELGEIGERFQAGIVPAPGSRSSTV